jgi:MFS family permease
VVGATFLLALLWDANRPAVHAMVADLVPPRDRPRAFALQYVAVNLGFAVAPALAGWLVAFGYSWIFLAAAAVQVGWAIFVWALLVETRPAVLGGPTGGRAGLGTALRDPVYLPFLGLCALLTLMPHQGSVALPAWMASQGHSEATFGSVVALNGLLIVLVQPWVADAVGRLDPARVFGVASILYGVGFALHGAHPAVQVHALAVATWTLGEILVAPVQSSVAAALAPPEARGRYQGLMGTSFAVAGIVAPLVGAGVMERWGGEALWSGALGLGAACALGVGALAPSLRRRLAAVAV